jgi:saccharopine dehydrogenase (NAD+, L-lysine-forming)
LPKKNLFIRVGCTIVKALSWKDAPADAYIIGLKELPDEDSPLSHQHIFFAHCFKNQRGWKDILKRFIKGNGVLLDLEFLVDEKGRRIAAFGYHAGFAGTALGLDVWAHQQLSHKQIFPSVEPYPDEKVLIDYIQNRLDGAGTNIEIFGGYAEEEQRLIVLFLFYSCCSWKMAAYHGYGSIG